MDKALKKIFTDISSANYRVLWGSGAGRGTFIILRVRDNTTSLRFTGTDAQYFFTELKEAWAKSRHHFDALCRREDYSA